MVIGEEYYLFSACLLKSRMIRDWQMDVLTGDDLNVPKHWNNATYTYRIRQFKGLFWFIVKVRTFHL